MSADNGYVIRINEDGKFVLQQFFASDDAYSPIENDPEKAPMFDTLEEAVLHYSMNAHDRYWSEYGLKLELTQKKETKMVIQHYVRKPFMIEAVQVTDENILEVSQWCEGEIHNEPKGPYIRVDVKNPLTPRQTKAFVGDWVLASKRGFKVYTDSAFNSNFNPESESADLTNATFDGVVGTTETKNVFDAGASSLNGDHSDRVDPWDAIQGKRS